MPPKRLIYLLTMFFFFAGFEVYTTLSQNLKRPKRDLPLALVWIMFLVVVFYLTVMLSFLGQMTTERPLTSSRTPFLRCLGRDTADYKPQWMCLPSQRSCSPSFPPWSKNPFSRLMLIQVLENSAALSRWGGLSPDAQRLIIYSFL